MAASKAAGLGMDGSRERFCSMSGAFHPAGTKAPGRCEIVALVLTEALSLAGLSVCFLSLTSVVVNIYSPKTLTCCHFIEILPLMLHTHMSSLL